MENKHFEQTTGKSQHRTPSRPFSGNYKADEARAEELNAISPLFRKISRKPVEVSPVRWKAFSAHLAQQLETSHAPFWQTMRDKLVSTDSHLFHWFWILLALILLALAVIILTLSLTEPSAALAAVQLISASGLG